MILEELEPRLLLSCVTVKRGSSLSVNAGGDQQVFVTEEVNSIVVECYRLIPDLIPSVLRSFNDIKNINIVGGNTADWIDVFLEGDTKTTVGIVGNSGDDFIRVELDTVNAPINVHGNLGNGNDIFRLNIQNDFKSNLTTNINGGSGNDDVMVYDYFGDIFDTAKLSVSCSLGTGNDTLLVFIDPRPWEPDDNFRLKSQPTVRVSGGGGSISAANIDTVMMDKGLVDMARLTIANMEIALSCDEECISML